MSCNFNIWSAKHTQKITVYSLKRNSLRLVMGDVKHATNAMSASATGKQQQDFPGRPGSLCCSYAPPHSWSAFWLRALGMRRNALHTK